MYTKLGNVSLILGKYLVPYTSRHVDVSQGLDGGLAPETGERHHEKGESVNLHSNLYMSWLVAVVIPQTAESLYVISYLYVDLCPDMCSLARCPCVSVSCVKKISRKPQRQSGVWRKQGSLGIFHESWRRKVLIDPSCLNGV